MARKYTSISVATTLSATISSSATTLTVANAADLLGDATLSAGNVDQFTVAIDPETVNEEIVFVTAANTGTNTLTVQRNRAGTTPIIHNTGATIKHVLTGDDLNAFASAVSPISTMRFTGATTGSTTVQASATASGTLTLPAATDTLVGKATTDTLSNKSVALGSNTVTGTTAQFNTALTDNDFATVAGAETLTNKNLTSGTNTFPTSLVTTTGSQTLSSKTIDYNSNTLTNFPSGAQVLLSTTTLSSTEVTISSIDSSYRDLLIYIYDVKLSAPDHIFFRAYSSGTSNPVYHTVSYSDLQYSPNTTQIGSGILGETVYLDQNGIKLTLPGISDNATTTSNNNECYYTVLIRNYQSPFPDATIQYTGNYLKAATGGVSALNGVAPLRKGAQAIDRIRLYANGKTFDSGSIKIYGIN